MGDAPLALIYTHVSFGQLLIFQLATELHSVLNNCSVTDSIECSCKSFFCSKLCSLSWKLSKSALIPKGGKTVEKYNLQARGAVSMSSARDAERRAGCVCSQIFVQGTKRKNS